MPTPSKPDNDETFTFRLPRQHRVRLAEHAARTGNSEAKLVRHAVAALIQTLDKQETQQ